MAQRETRCGSQLHVCATRVTRLDELGTPTGGADGAYVTNKVVSIQRTEVKEAGADLTLQGGCDCPIVTYKGRDKFKRYEFEVAKGAFEPALEEMLLGGDVILDDSDVPIPVGRTLPGPGDCDDVEITAALEFWCKNIQSGTDAQDPDLPWIHHVYPRSLWSTGTSTFGNDFAQEALSGFTRANLQWGDGPYGDGPEAVFGVEYDIRFGAIFATTEDPPAADCDFVTVTPGS